MSKINTEYWGANVSPGSASGYTLHVGLSTNNIRNLIAQGKYNPNTDSFDLSVSPWGIGPSAAGRYGVIGVFRNGSVDGATPGKISKIKFLTDDENRNMPFTLAIKPDTLSAASNNTWMYNRINGGIVVDENNYMCNTNYDGTTAGTNLPSGSTSNTYSNIQVPTYLDYSAVRLLIPGFYWLNTLTGETGQYSFAASSMSTAKTNWNNWNPANPENIVITGIRVTAIANGMYSGTPASWGTTPINKTPIVIPLKQHKMNELSYLWNGGGVDDSSKWIGIAPWTIGLQDTYYSIPNYNEIQTGYLSRFIPVDEQRYTSSTTPTLSQVWRYGFRTENTSNPVYSNYSDEKHVFSDVTYRMRPLVWNAINGLFVEFHEGQTLSNVRQQLRISSIYDVESSSGNWKNTLMSILLHEIAFYGFPFSIQWQTTFYDNAYAIGSDDCYLPVFDEHLVTTGNYMSGAASLELPNSTWGNVFDDSMPEYDPTYQPPKPDGGDDENDRGMLDIRALRYLNFDGNKYFGLSSATLALLLSFLSQVNLNDPDTTRMLLDFKGSNPTDYIVGLYAFPFTLQTTAPIMSHIFVGPVDTSIQAPRAYRSSNHTIDFGTIVIDEYYGDFRDYSPYTTLELYVPLFGSTTLDPSFYMGHTLSVDIIYDLETGSATARIMRDNIIDVTLTADISAKIPLSALLMGDYQRSIHELQSTFKRNQINRYTSLATFNLNNADEIGSSVMGGRDSVLAGRFTGGSGNSLLGYISKSIGAFGGGLETNEIMSNLNYRMSHTAPGVITIGAADAYNNMLMYNRAVLFIKRAKMLSGYEPSIYARTVGHACCYQSTIGNESGFIVCSNIDTNGIPATNAEINAIKRAFSKGVIV